LPAPGASAAPDGTVFCCHGCATAFAMIHGCGLDKYYALRDGAQSAPVASGSRSYADYDDPTFLSQYTHALSGGHMSGEFLLSGVHCGACLWLLERLPRLLPGVIEARVDIARSGIALRWDASVIKLSRIASTLDALGYAPRPPRRAAARAERTASDRRELVAIGVAGACAGNAMLYAVSLYAGLFEGIDTSSAALFRGLSLLVTGISLAWPGRVFFRNAWFALRTRTPHLDLPITLALVAGAMWSVVSTIRGTGEVYFDSLSVLVFVLLSGRYLQRSRQQAGAEAVELLFALSPTSARRVSGGGIEEVPVETLRDGDVIEVRAADSFPADGEVASGESAADESLLTGESAPRRLTAGDRVFAGSVNVRDVLRVRVRAAGEQTRVAQLMRLVEESSRRRAPIVQMADRLSGAFVIGMLALAIVSFGLYLWLNPSVALERAVALLVVTCPCALGLATPLTLVVALGRAARRGILIKGGDVLQKIAAPGLIFLDKTGTLTFGRPVVTAWLGDASLRPFVAALEARLSHPLAVALREGYLDAASMLAVRDVSHVVGGGVRGTVENRALVVGSPAFVLPTCDSLSLRGHELAQQAQRLAAEGLTPIAIAADGELVAVAACGDAVRPDARAALFRLRRLGYEIGILSGDHPAVVATVARELDVDPTAARGGLSPEDKLSLVEAARMRWPSRSIIFVGDGVNDAAALAGADVGIAVHGGAEAALAAADVYITRPGLSPIVELIEGGRTGMNTIRRNLGASFIYNIIAVTGTLLGFVSPLLAALIMPLSSVTVLTIALRSRIFRGPSPYADPTPLPTAATRIPEGSIA